MGLCSATNAGANGNIQLCVNPKTCADRDSPHRESSLQQITVRGPIHLTVAEKTPPREEIPEPIQEGSEK